MGSKTLAQNTYLKTTAKKFEEFLKLFEPQSVEVALAHFLHKPIDKRYLLSVKEGSKDQEVHIHFPDQSIAIIKEKIK